VLIFVHVAAAAASQIDNTPLDASAAPPLFGPVFDVGAEIIEVSAAALDPDGDAIWTSGDEWGDTTVALTDLETGDTASFTVTGAQSFDWEAMVMDDQRNLWILDVGDNGALRDHVTCYQVAARVPAGEPVLPVLRSISVTYPDGPMDVEAAAYDDERIYLFEKIPLDQSRDALIVSIDVSAQADSVQVARQEGTIPVFLWITDASVSPEEGYLYLLTYLGIFECRGWRSGDWNTLFIMFFFLGQQEAMVALGRNSFYVGIEPGPFFYMRNWFPFLPLADERVYTLPSGYR